PAPSPFYTIVLLLLARRPADVSHTLLLAHLPPPARPLLGPTLFPYTTLFRSRAAARRSSSSRAASCPASARSTSQRRSRSHDPQDRKSTRLNSSHQIISYAVFCLKKKSRSKAPRAVTTWRYTRSIRREVASRF